MDIVDTTKFVIGIVFAIIGVGVLLSARSTRGFGQRKQAGVLLIVAAIVFTGIGLGYIDI